MKTWRDIARPIIAKVVSELGREDTPQLRAALRDAYPFGERRYHPYRIWCDEINVQLGKRQFGASNPRKGLIPSDGQRSLF